MDEFEKLQQLTELFEAGTLTEEEFTAAKARLLGLEPRPEGEVEPISDLTDRERRRPLQATDEPVLPPNTPEAISEQDGAVAPGWYADPDGRYQGRYWDGSAWTGHVTVGDSLKYAYDDGVYPEDTPVDPRDSIEVETGDSKKSGWSEIVGVAVVVLVFFFVSGFLNRSDDDSAGDGQDGIATVDAQSSVGPSSEGHERLVVDGVTVESHPVCDLLGTVDAKNDSGGPVEIFVEVGLYDGGTLIEVDSGYWNLSTGWEGQIGALVWADQRYPDFEELECRIREVRVSERG